MNSLGNENDSAFVSFVCFGQKSLDPESLIGNRTRKGVNPTHHSGGEREKSNPLLFMTATCMQVSVSNQNVWSTTMPSRSKFSCNKDKKHTLWSISYLGS